MWVSVKSGLCEYVRPPGVWWSFTSGTLQHRLRYISQTGLRVIWQRWHTCRISNTGTHTHTDSVGYQHTLQRGKERETWQRKVSRDLSYLIPSLHLSLSFLFSLIIHSHPTYLLFSHNFPLKRSPLNTLPCIYISKKNLYPSSYDLFLS